MADCDDTCKGCGAEMNWMEEFDNAIHSLVTLSHQNFENPAECIAVGLSYFVRMAHECAPDENAAEELITHIINNFKEESNGERTNVTNIT